MVIIVFVSFFALSSHTTQHFLTPNLFFFGCQVAATAWHPSNLQVNDIWETLVPTQSRDIGAATLLETLVWCEVLMISSEFVIFFFIKKKIVMLVLCKWLYKKTSARCDLAALWFSRIKQFFFNCALKIKKKSLRWKTRCVYF